MFHGRHSRIRGFARSNGSGAASALLYGKVPKRDKDQSGRRIQGQGLSNCILPRFVLKLKTPPARGFSKFSRHSAAVRAEVEETTSADPIRWCSNFQTEGSFSAAPQGGFGGRGIKGSMRNVNHCVYCVSCDAVLFLHSHAEVGSKVATPCG